MLKVLEVAEKLKVEAVMERTKRISGWKQTVEDEEREDLHHLSHPQS